MDKDVVIFFIIAIVILLIPFAIIYFCYRWLSRKGLKKIALILVGIIVLILTFSIYRVVSPEDSFYKDDFKDGLNLPFPSSGDIISKDASYPDTHGKYCACSLIKFNKNDYNYVAEFLKNNPKFSSNDSLDVSTDEFNNVFHQTTNLDTSKSLKYFSKIENIKNRISIRLINNRISNHLVLYQRCNF